MRKINDMTKSNLYILIQWLISAAAILVFTRVVLDLSWGQCVVVAAVGSFTAIAAATASSRRRAAVKGAKSRRGEY
jgi:membrane-associated phospholipid phosphatase